MKLVEIPGRKKNKRESQKDKINEPETIVHLYRGINEFKKVTNKELTW
jgi:hypothetical protein